MHQRLNQRGDILGFDKERAFAVADFHLFVAHELQFGNVADVDPPILSIDPGQVEPVSLNYYSSDQMVNELKERNDEKNKSLVIRILDAEID